jgi:hypothetical protein
VFTLRCTQRLLARLKASPNDVPSDRTTRLGDWYANLVHVGRQQLVLAVSEQTFLPVVVAAAPNATLVARLAVATGEVLRALRVDPLAVDSEVAAMATAAIGRTLSRQVTGVMVDFAKQLEFYLEDESSLLSCSLRLAETPCSPLYKTAISPDRATLLLFVPSRSATP